MSGALGSVARIGLTAAGYYFGGPAGAFAAQIGASLLFPEKLPDIEGQRITDAPVTTSMEGAPMSEFFGRWCTAGQVWWDGGMVEHRETDSVGKGGPSQKVVSYRYTRSYALGLGKSIKSVRRIWRLNQLIYDRRPQLEGESDAAFAKRLAASDELEERMTIYTGTLDQMPDPTIEAVEGVGNAPAYRKRSYIVFTDDDVTDTNGAIPTYRVEVSNGGYAYTSTTELAADYLPDWVEGSADPRPFRDPVNYLFDYRFDGVTYDTFAEAKDAAEADIGYDLTDFFGWRIGTYGDPPSKISGLSTDIDPGEREYLNLVTAGAAGAAYVGSLNVGNVRVVSDEEFTAVPDSGDDPFPFVGFFGLGLNVNGYIIADIVSGYMYYLRQTGTVGYGDPAPTIGVNGWANVNNCVESLGCPYPGSGDNAVGANRQPFTDISVRRLPSPPTIPGSDLPDWPDNPDDYTWDPDTLEIYSKEPWVQVAGSYRWLSLYSVTGGGNSTVQRKPLGPCLPVGHPDDDETFWTAARDAAVAAGTLPSSVNTYNPAGTGDINTFPRNVSYVWTRTYEAVTVLEDDAESLARIVRRCCRLSTLTDEQIDVSDLTELVPGYELGRLGLTARGAIDTLRPFGFFDCVTSGLQVKFPRRGKASVAELTLEDLGCHAPGEEEPERIRPDRSNDTPLPQLVRVTYINPASEFQRGQQIRGRVTVASENKLDVELPIVMTDDKAAQIRDVLMAERYLGRETYTTPARPKWAWLEPADPVVFPLRSQSQRAIVTSKRFVAGGRIELELRRDDATPYATSPAGVPSGAGEQTLEPLGDTTLVAIDGPALTDAQNEPGLHLAARGDGARWKGCGVFQSLDGGSNFSRIAVIEAPATMGRITAPLPTGPHHLWDRTNIIEVTLDAGTLESVGEEAASAGVAPAWIGAAGRWELVVFADAVLTGTDGQGRKQYQVNTFLRGLMGTEWAIGLSQANDHFILARTCARLPLDRSAIGVERMLKAVSFGKLVESGPTQAITPEGIALKPYAPVLAEGQRNDDGDLDIYAVRRTRMPPEWLDYDVVPLNEESEAYEVDILDGDTVVGTLSENSFPIRYQADDQLADFGSLQASVSVRIYQISASVGRGYPLEATL